MSETGILVDFGSTFTKINAFDFTGETFLGQGRTESTVRTHLTIGLKTPARDWKEMLSVEKWLVCR